MCIFSSKIFFSSCQASMQKVLLFLLEQTNFRIPKSLIPQPVDINMRVCCVKANTITYIDTLRCLLPEFCGRKFNTDLNRVRGYIRQIELKINKIAVTENVSKYKCRAYKNPIAKVQIFFNYTCISYYSAFVKMVKLRCTHNRYCKYF